MIRRILPLFLLAACGKAVDPVAEENEAVAAAFVDTYPASITPPPGTTYPCEMSALPKDLTGIPPSHHAWINHAFTFTLKAIHVKLKAYAALGGPPPKAVEEAYLRDTGALVQNLRDEPCPKSLESARDDLVATLEKQIIFFTKAFAAKRSGTAWETILQIPEGHEASAHVQGCYAKLLARYPAASPAVKNTFYHHL
jgi:hypothetical protein